MGGFPRKKFLRSVFTKECALGFYLRSMHTSLPVPSWYPPLFFFCSPRNSWECAFISDQRSVCMSLSFRRFRKRKKKVCLVRCPSLFVSTQQGAVPRQPSASSFFAASGKNPALQWQWMQEMLLGVFVCESCCARSHCSERDTRARRHRALTWFASSPILGHQQRSCVAHSCTVCGPSKHPSGFRLRGNFSPKYRSCTILTRTFFSLKVVLKFACTFQ